MPPWNRWFANSKCCLALSRAREFRSTTRRRAMIARYDWPAATAICRWTSFSFCCATTIWSPAWLRCAQATGVRIGTPSVGVVCVCTAGTTLAPPNFTGLVTLTAVLSANGLNHHVQDRNEQDVEERREEHPARDRGADRMAAFLPRA